uniref:Uncharacterized protein n=1 Tax=Picea sitchensis TaxID=3332 RepID=A9NTI9_PICSI|nr:unknown [Picea sitchensis]
MTLATHRRCWTHSPLRRTNRRRRLPRSSNQQWRRAQNCRRNHFLRPRLLGNQGLLQMMAAEDEAGPEVAVDSVTESRRSLDAAVGEVIMVSGTLTARTMPIQVLVEVSMKTILI